MAGPVASNGRLGSDERGVSTAGSIRRSRFLVLYWEEGSLIAHEYNRGVRVKVGLVPLTILDSLDVWTARDQVCRTFAAVGSETVSALLEELASNGLLEIKTESGPPSGLENWGEWNPIAGFFHGATRNVEWAQGEQRVRFEAEYDARRPDAPAPAKHYGDVTHLMLPGVRHTGELRQTLLARRTWRRFGRRPLTVEDVADLLHLTWGVQKQVSALPGPCVNLKTSPAGGACHSIEAYLYARHVQGIEPGFYHYDSEAHRLSLVKPRASRDELERFLGGQFWFRSAGIVVFMTAVFARKQHRYQRLPRAYRSILIEAGHLCQTFCLLATARGLAPFCTAALADTAIEQSLGLDGTTEAVLYAAGAGTRPVGVRWGQWPRHAKGRPYLRPVATRSARKVRG